MRELRIGLALGLAAAGLLAAAQLVQAATPRIALNPSQGGQGTTVAVDGSGFCGSCASTVTILFARQPLTQGVRVAADGTFHTSFVVPGGGPGGAQQVEADQAGAAGGQYQALTSFFVTISQPPPGQPAATPVPATPPGNPTAVPGVSNPSAIPGTPGPGAGPQGPVAAATANSGGKAAAASAGFSLLPVLLVLLVLAIVAGAAVFVVHRSPR